VDSDLADAVEALKAVFSKRKLACSFVKAPPALIEELRKELHVPPRFRNFLLAANPAKVETVTPVERIRLIPAEELVKAQQPVRAGRRDAGRMESLLGRHRGELAPR